MTDSVGLGAAVPKEGPTHLDIACKQALQRILKPCHFIVIVPWMQGASVEAKKDVLRLAKAMAQGERKAEAPVSIVNPHGRERPQSLIPVSADRIQVDLLRNRHGADQRDAGRESKRLFFAEFSKIPTCESVGDFFRLREDAVDKEEACKILTEQARQQLRHWQMHGPERDPELSSQVMRSLRTISRAVQSLPTYTENRLQEPGGHNCRTSLYEYSKVAPRGYRTFKVASQVTLQHSSSAPGRLPAYITQEEVDAVKQPGGFFVELNDNEKLAMLKNRERGSRTKIAASGGAPSYLTTSQAMAEDLHLRVAS